MTKANKADDLLELAWGLIANTGWDAHRGTGSMPGASPGWHEAALRWRDDYFKYCSSNRIRNGLFSREKKLNG